LKRNLRHEVGVGVLVTTAAFLTGWMAIQAGAVGLGERVEVTATFDSVVGLTQGAAVMVAGVEVGKVTSLYAKFNRAGVDLSLDPDAKIRKDVHAAVRARSVLGEKYVELLPISTDAPLLQDGDVIGVTSSGTEIDEVVSSISPLLKLIEPERLRVGFNSLLSIFESDPQRPQRMVEDLEVTLRNARAASEIAVTSARDAQQLIAESRAMIAEIRQSTAELDPLLTRADRAMANLELAAADLPGATGQLQPALDEANALLAELRQGLRPLTENPERLDLILENLSEIDKWELRRLLREEGIKVRITTQEVAPSDPDR
jgi:phospholipid/cholesterol/gamma-HCH transport system substrate-binding protein